MGRENASISAAVLFMIDTPESSRRSPPDKAEAGLEEARLRQQAIGVKLRHMFDQVVNEPVPDEFLDILRRADDRSSGGDKT
ncbi:hypothetical protein GGR13_000717 [Brevundimonas variabilis]|uniref:Anti-sigma factor NepR domain-containing protein n=2 Tax=Brevundimonas variabilis TaxID=74312 RepID=A0A7W9CGE2_9CAUL|nr:hypothetical protein [Brevundimonas variabilis]